MQKQRQTKQSKNETKQSEVGGQAAGGGLPTWGDGRSMAISNPGDDEGGRCS